MRQWSTMKKLIWLRFLQAASVILETVTGTSPLSLTNAVAQAIYSLTQTGKCTQASTPTPSDPVDIYCNNGALKMVDDELPAAYKRVLGFQCDNNAMWKITDFKLRGSDTVRISFSITAACNVFGCYQGADATDNYDLYASVSSGSKYFRYGSGTYLSYFSNDNLNRRFDVVYTPNGSTGMPQDSTWSPLTFECANDLLIGSTTTTGTSAKLKGKLFGDFIVDGRLHLIPCERVSDSVLGYYDIVGDAFYEPSTGFDGAVSLGYDGSHYSLQTVGTAEVLTISADGAETQTVTDIPDLFAADDYADTQDIISGTLTRKVVVKILDGTESWSFRVVSGFNQAWIRLPDSKSALSRAVVVCSHFESPPEQLHNNMMTLGAGYLWAYADNAVDGTWQAWLATQKAAGTPVIIIYPLQTETTEQTEPHDLYTAEGDNIVSWTYPGSIKTVEYACPEPQNKVGTAKVGTAKAG